VILPVRLKSYSFSSSDNFPGGNGEHDRGCFLKDVGEAKSGKVEEILGEPVNSSRGKVRKHRGFLEDMVKLSEENFLNHIHRFPEL